MLQKAKSVVTPPLLLMASHEKALVISCFTDAVIHCFAPNECVGTCKLLCGRSDNAHSDNGGTLNYSCISTRTSVNVENDPCAALLFIWESFSEKMRESSALTVHPNFVFYRLWNKLPKIENIPNIAIDDAVLSPNVTFVRWKVHRDWVTQVTFYLSMRKLSSLHRNLFKYS